MFVYFGRSLARALLFHQWARVAIWCWLGMVSECDSGWDFRTRTLVSHQAHMEWNPDHACWCVHGSGMMTIRVDGACRSVIGFLYFAQHCRLHHKDSTNLKFEYLDQCCGSWDQEYRRLFSNSNIRHAFLSGKQTLCTISKLIKV
jgi:hypothetical protein